MTDIAERVVPLVNGRLATEDSADASRYLEGAPLFDETPLENRARKLTPVRRGVREETSDGTMDLLGGKFIQDGANGEGQCSRERGVWSMGGTGGPT